VGAYKLAAVVITTALILTVVGGCGEPDPRVDRLMRESNSHLKKSAEYLQDVAESGKKLADLSAGKTDAESAAGQKELLIEARKAAEASLGEVEKALSALNAVGRLRPGASMKTYIEMKVDAFSEQKKSLEAGRQAMDLRIKLADDTIAGVPVSEAWVQTLKSISELDQESRRYADNAANLNMKADRYYESKNPEN
jgi:hypothetical protein